MLKVDNSTVMSGPMMVDIDFTFTPIAGMSDFVVAVSGQCMYHGKDQVEILDWEFKITEKPHLSSPEIQSSLKLLYHGDLEKDVEVAMTAIVLEKMKEVPAEKPAEVVGAPIDWIAVMRAFDEEFDMNYALRSAAEDVSEDNAISEYDVNCGYGNNFTVDVSLDTDAIADNMEDSVCSSLRDFCKNKAAAAQ
jgi:hypothetical protein